MGCVENCRNFPLKIPAFFRDAILKCLALLIDLDVVAFKRFSTFIILGGFFVFLNLKHTQLLYRNTQINTSSSTLLFYYKQLITLSNKKQNLKYPLLTLYGRFALKVLCKQPLQNILECLHGLLTYCSEQKTHVTC